MISDVLTEQEVAERLKLTHPSAKQTIQRMARAGLIRGNKVGREWRFMRQAVDDFLMMGGKRS